MQRQTHLKQGRGGREKRGGVEQGRERRGEVGGIPHYLLAALEKWSKFHFISLDFLYLPFQSISVQLCKYALFFIQTDSIDHLA